MNICVSTHRLYVCIHAASSDMMGALLFDSVLRLLFAGQRSYVERFFMLNSVSRFQGSLQYDVVRFGKPLMCLQRDPTLSGLAMVCALMQSSKWGPCLGYE